MKPEYSDYLITFDIETTTFTESDEQYTDLYLASFFRFRFNVNATSDLIEASNHIRYVRSWSEVNNYFEALNKQAKRFNKIQIVYVHNLAYEFDGLIKNCSFIQSNFDNSKLLFIKPRKPAYIRLDNIELRCSYILLNKSLDSLGKIYNYPKLNINYRAQYFSFSSLPDIEYTYNERDVKLTMLSILKECKKYSYINTVADIPLTYTSFTRKNNLSINSKKDIKQYKNRNAVQKSYTPEYIQYLEQIYSGGYTHANAFYTFVPLQDIISVDITSSYPDSMVHRYYPFNFHSCAEGVDVLQWFRFIVRQNNDLDYVQSHYIKPFKYGFFATVTLSDVKLKKYNRTEIPYISVSKIINETFRAVSDNGRLVSADNIIIALTHIDYFLIQQFYDFELVAVDDLFYTSQFRALSNFTLKCVNYYADNKSVLKSLSKKSKLEKSDFFCKRTEQYIFDDDIIKNIIKLPKKQRSAELDILLQSAKVHLNAQYGISVQRLFQETYQYIAESDEYIKVYDTELKRDLYRNFEEGLFIPLYSKLNLFTYALFILLNSSADLIYSDTDSWKIKGDIDTIISLTEAYNNNHNEMTDSNQLYNIGQFDMETVYDYFICGGCKKYISLKDGIVTGTIAGVPKIPTSEALTELYHTCGNDFSFLCDIAFKPNTLLSSSVTHKLSSKYHTDSFSGIVIDENGLSNYIQFNNMVELVDTDYFLLNTNTPSNFTYLKYLEYKQKRHINIKPTVLYSEGGQIKYDYLSELPDEIETVTDVNADNYVKE